MAFADILQQSDGIKVNVNGAYGDLTVDPSTGKYVVDVNTTGAPVYGQPLETGAFLSSKVAGIPVMGIVIVLFLLAAFGLGGRLLRGE